MSEHQARDERKLCSETRRDGTPCQAYATQTGKCAGHSGIGLTTDPREAQRQSLAIRQEKARTRAMNAQDHLAAQLEKHAETITNAVIASAAEGDMQAVRFIYERAYGKPVERVVSVQEGLRPSEMSDEQRAELRRQLVAEHPELLELVPKRAVSKPDSSSETA